MTQKPTTGRIVHYVLANGDHRAALVTNGFGDKIANLTVFLDHANDLQTSAQTTGTGWEIKPQLIPQNTGAFTHGGGLHAASAHQDEDAKTPGTWHWPEREA